MHERDLFIDALEIDDPLARLAHLDAACGGDLVLRARIERLLQRSGEAQDFLEQPAVDLCSDIIPEIFAEQNQQVQVDCDYPTMTGKADDTGPTLLANPANVVLASSTDVGAVSRSALNPQTLATGMLFGRYRVERVLGIGGMGIVYLAEDLRLGRRVALKIPNFDADHSLRLVERFRREARTMASVLHRNLCPIFDVDEQDGMHYLTMAFVDGAPLSQVIKQMQPYSADSGSLETSDRIQMGSGTPSFSARQIAELIHKLALALDAAHRAGVVHRDLKPANVMIDRSGEPILMDFGLAWMVHETDSRVTQTGAILGTPAYMSPEQADGEVDKIGPSSDIYSLGVILYELLTGRPVHTGSVTQVLHKLINKTPTRPSEIRSDVDPLLEEICCKAISRRPEDRYATAAELAAALANFLDLRPSDSPSDKTGSSGHSGHRIKSQPDARDTSVSRVCDSSPPRAQLVAAADNTALLSSFAGTVNSPHPQVTRHSKSRIVLVSLMVVGVFGFSLAMMGQKRGVDTSNPSVTVPSNPVKLAGEPVKPAIPFDSSKPFAIVRNGQDLRSFETLVPAIHELQPGDSIEIRSNERLPIHLTEPVTKPLAIRSGAGYRPMLVFAWNDGKCHVESDFSVEGCDLDLRPYATVLVDRKSTWRFHRCRIWGSPSVNVPRMRFTECIIVSLFGIGPTMDGTATDYEFDNCLIRNTYTVLRYPDIGTHILRLRNCTIYAVSDEYPRLILLGKEAKLTVEATGNVFHCVSQAREMIEPKSQPQVTWIGVDNCFSGYWFQIWEKKSDNSIVLKDTGLSGWNKLWKEPERDSREVDLLFFEWGRIQRLPNPERFLAVRDATEKILAQHKRPGIGPDWNLVGPGDAYVRALAAEGRAVPKAELRPEPREDGPIVLLRAGKEVRGYQALTPALDAAQDKDVIELRTDGIVKDTHWTGDSRLLTIRAGAGYTPMIDENLVSSGTDRLILEGLTIRYVLLASGGALAAGIRDDKQPLFPTQGSVVRVMNCMLLGKTNNSVSDTWMFNDGESIPEIVNCVFGTLRIGLRSGGKARLRNSVFGDCRPNVESLAAQTGKLEIEQCVFWLPEPALDDYWNTSFRSQSSIQVQARHSIFLSPIDLTNSHPVPIAWTGTGNLFVKPAGFHHGATLLELEEFQTTFQTEADSIELPPWEFDPAQWRILRGKSSGYQPHATGTDYGADIDRLVAALGPNAHLQAKSPALVSAPGPAIAPFDANQAKVHQKAWAKHLNVPVEYTNSIGMQFVLIPPGEFMMGSTPAEIEAALSFAKEDDHWTECVKSEAPQHKVILTRPIYLGVHEVTQAQYEKVMGQNVSHFAPTGTGRDAIAGMSTIRHPAEMMSWDDAADFCAKLSMLEKLAPFYVRSGEKVEMLDGTGYRLPTEAEWEFGGRAGTNTHFWIGDWDEDLVHAGWFYKNSGSRTHAVGELKDNPFGLYDIHGNVWEWVQDRWGAAYYEQSEPSVDPNGPAFDGFRRVLRGGTWNDYGIRCVVSLRHASVPTYRDFSTGCRVALTVDAVKVAIAERSRSPAAPTTQSHGWPIGAPRPAIAPFDANQARAHQVAWAKHLGVPVEYTNAIGIKLVLIPPGEFTMGSTPADVDEGLKFVGASTEWRTYIQSEAPSHKLILTQPFFLGVYEVTQAEYEKVMGRDRNPSWFAPTGMGKDHVAGIDVAKHPVEMVSWNDAAEFCAKLSQFEKLQPSYLRAGESVTLLQGTGYRLPTEAQWEFACRAGTESRFWFGDKYEDLLQADRFNMNSVARTHAVGELQDNPFGLHDMHGNVWEWVQDSWEPSYYGTLADKTTIDPSGPLSAGLHRILRGGHWRSIASISRASSRYGAVPTLQQNCAGFRVSVPVAAVKAAITERAP